VQKQQHWVVTIPATNGDPLFDAADRNKARLINTLSGMDGELLCIARPQERK
jgi:hypothetical protein